MEQLRGHYDLINYHRQANSGCGWIGGREGQRNDGRGRGHEGDITPARSVQALQQASSLINEFAASLQRDQGQEEGNNAGNSFGVASYGGCQGRGNGQGGPRTMSKVITEMRRQISASRSHVADPPQVVESNCEMDSHADTCCLGKNFLPIYFTGKVCDVTPFLDSLPRQGDVEICSGATAYEDAYGNTIILIINEALWMGNLMEHSLLNPYQIRAFGVQVCDDPTDNQRFFGIQASGADVAFKMQGSTCMFKTRTPTEWELKNCPHVELTSDIEWNPSDPHFQDHVECLSSGDTNIAIQSYDTRHRRPNIDSATLSKQWGIGLEAAKHTLKCTTQAGIRYAIHPLTRCYHTDYMTLHHRRLHSTFYSDTLFSRVQSLHGHKSAQVISDGRFIHVYPMESKSSAGEGLSHFVSDVGIPDVLVTDNAPEMIGANTDFQKTCRHYKIKTRQTEPHTPQQNRAELAIRELKRKWRSKMQDKMVPKRL